MKSIVSRCVSSIRFYDFVTSLFYLLIFFLKTVNPSLTRYDVPTISRDYWLLKNLFWLLSFTLLVLISCCLFQALQSFTPGDFSLLKSSWLLLIITIWDDGRVVLCLNQWLPVKHDRIVLFGLRLVCCIDYYGYQLELTMNSWIQFHYLGPTIPNLPSLVLMVSTGYLLKAKCIHFNLRLSVTHYLRLYF